eukprot:g16903.t2
MMEHAYAAVGQALVHLVSGTGGYIDHATNQDILRSTLQQRPVALGYALSTFARRLQDDGQPSQDPAGASTSPPSQARVPHIGIRLALEVLVGSSYDPFSPHSFVSVIDALGEDRLEVLLHAPGESEPLLPWVARLCLLHACLAAGSAGARRWSWLPAVADSASSLALQEIATKGGSGSGNGAVTNGKGRARAPPPPPPSQIDEQTALVAGRTEAFSVALMAQVCGELATAGLAGPEPPAASTCSFLSSYRDMANGLADTVLSSGRGAGLLPVGHVSASFRLKLQALRDALLCGVERDKEAEEHPAPAAVARAIAGVGLENLEIHPQSVRRALGRGRCGGEAFVLAVQAVLKRSVPSSEMHEEVGPNNSSNGGRKAPVKLKNALEACLFGTGLPVGRGLLDAVAVEDRDLGSSATASRTVGTRPSRAATSVPPGARQAGALLQGLVEEGVRIRDLVLTLLGMHQERERRRPLSRPPAASIGVDATRRRRGADVVATVQPSCDFLRSPLTAVVRAFVEWLAENPWVWGATEGVEGEDFEGDFAAAVLAVSAVYPAPLAAAATAGRGGGSGDGADTGLVAAIPIEQHSASGSQAGGASWGSPWADPTDVLDRLVAGAAMAMGHAESGNVEWIHVLQRVASAASATESLRAYAVACVEKSAALGGQAPFRVRHMGKRRFSQVRGKELWGLLSGLLEGVYGLSGGALKGQQAPPAVLIRAAATTAIIASRKMSLSWMISPGLLGSGPVRTVIDMLNSANGRVTSSDVLTGLIDGPGDEGPALAADFFAALVAAAAAVAIGETDSVDNGGTILRSQATAWLGRALSAPHSRGAPGADGLSFDVDTLAATTLARHLIRRVPYEAKPVLIAVQEAAELATAGRGALGAGASSIRRSGKLKLVCRKGKDSGSAGLAVVASLLKAVRAAVDNPLLPLSVAVLPPPPDSERGESVGTSGASALSVDEGGGTTDASSASVTVEMLLNSFVQSPAAVRRSVREAMRQGKYDNELRAVQTTLRRALCTAPAPPRQDSAPAAATDNVVSGGGAPTPRPIPLSAGLGARKAPACLLAGYLVESGVPGWEDTKAAMIPPPHQLLEAAEGPVGGASLHRQPPLTALRLEVWLRSLLCDVGSSRFDVSIDMEKSFPDVFRTARTLARAIARHASSLVTGAVQGSGGTPPNGYHPAYLAGDSGDLELLRPYSVNTAGGGDGGGDRVQEAGVVGRLEPARRALAGRLQSAPAAGALVSWVSSIVKTAKQFEPWLPWQAFADELRELVLQSVRQHAGGCDEDVGAGRALAAEAAVFAVCELLLAWTEKDEEVIATVFQPSLCSRALGTVVAPVTSDARPPIWLDVLRCLCDNSSWPPSQVDEGFLQELLTVAAAAAVWIGGDGPGKGLSGDRGTREAWVGWYGAKLGPLIPTSDAELRNWLVLTGAPEGKRDGTGISIRTGTTGAARSVHPREWEHWGRSPLQAAWNVPGGWRPRDEVGSDPADHQAQSPIVLAPFASWLRVVLRGGGPSPSCPDGLLEAYLRRMAREVYLPCQFHGASGEMARQWLGALIEAEATAEGWARKNATATTTLTSGAVSNGVAVKTEFSSEGGGAGTSSARRSVVRAFFREELLRFGSGEASASAAPVGGPLTWLWPLEAVVAACGKAGPFGGNVLARRRRGNAAPEGLPGDPTMQVVALDEPPSALARALCTVPHDLLCGARRFDRGGGQPSPAVATLRAFAMRAVDLAARALATPPCRHWSVARRLLLGLGLLYHALAKPESARYGERLQSRGGPPSAGAVGASGGSMSRADGGGEGAVDSQANAQAAALLAIETLVRTALGLGDDVENATRNGSSAARAASSCTGPVGRPSGSLLLTPACLALRPLGTVSCVGAADFAEALRGAGAWRAVAAFFRPRKSKAAPSLFFAGCDTSRRRGSAVETGEIEEEEKWE